MRELWRSKRTGRVRRGTQVSELRALFNSGILVDVIAEPLAFCLANEDGNDVRESMLASDYDIVGMKNDENGFVTGYLEQTKLGIGACQQFAAPLNPAQLVSDSTSLIDVMRKLREYPWLFVLSGTNIDAIVTRADLQKPPVRILLFGFITLLEMHLTYWVGQLYPSESWKEILAHPRVASANKILGLRKDRRENIDLSDCLQFCDKRTLAVTNNEFCRLLGFESSKSLEKCLEAAEWLRDKLSHAQDVVSGSTWEELIDLLAEIQSTIQHSEIAMSTRLRPEDNGMSSTI